MPKPWERQPRDHQGRWTDDPRGLAKRLISAPSVREQETSKRLTALFHEKGGPVDLKVEFTDNGSGRRVRALKADGSQVGSLDWYADGEIAWAGVGDPAYKRKGVARALLHAAVSADPNVHHSRILSEEGRKFASATRDITKPVEDHLEPNVAGPARAQRIVAALERGDNPGVAFTAANVQFNGARAARGARITPKTPPLLTSLGVDYLEEDEIIHPGEGVVASLDKGLVVQHLRYLLNEGGASSAPPPLGDPVQLLSLPDGVYVIGNFEALLALRIYGSEVFAETWVEQ